MDGAFTPAGVLLGNNRVIHPWSLESLGVPLTSFAWSTTASGAMAVNLGIFVPFSVAATKEFDGGFWYRGATAGGNNDIGIYTLDGKRLASTGAVSTGAVTSVNTAPFTTPVRLGPGVYLMAYSASTASLNFRVSIGAPGLASIGILNNAAAHPLPATVVLSWATNGILPVFGILEANVAPGI